MAHYLESPGTKANTVPEARALFANFHSSTIRTQLSHGDLLQMRPGAKYQGWKYRLAWRLYPRAAIRLLGDRLGTGLLVEAVK